MTEPAATKAQARRRRTIAVLCVLTVLGLGYVLLFTSLLGVRSVEVHGAKDVPAAQVKRVADVPDRRAMLRVDTDEIAARVATLPGIATVDVSRSWPSTVEITVTERTPLGYYNTGKQGYLVDANGVVYKKVDERPDGLPEFKLSKVGPDDAATKAATTVLHALPGELRGRVAVLRAETPGSVEFTLRGGKVVRWGDAKQSGRKADVLAVLMTRKGKTYDVSAPELPTVS